MTRLKTGKAGLNYILHEAAHNGNDVRNQYLTGINLVDGVSWYKQFQYCWDRAADGHETQLRHLIASFSDRELDPNNPNDVRLGHELAVEYAEIYYPNRQIIVGTQTDGQGGYIHCHMMVNDCDIIDSSCCNEQQRTFAYFMNTFDEFIKERGIVIDYGRNKDVVTKKKFEQIYEIKCAEVEAQRAELTEQIDAAKSAGDADKAAKLQKKFDEIKDPYIWKEHLRQRIQEAKEEATSYDAFVDELDTRGVIYDDSGKHNKFRLKEEEYAKFTDKTYPEKATCRGKTLNPEFSREALQAYFESLEIEDEDEAQIEPITAPEAPEPTETEGVDEIPEITVEAVVEPVDEPEEVSSEIADVEPKKEQSDEPKVRRVGRRSTKKKSDIDALAEAAMDDEGEFEDAALAAAGYADDAESEQMTDDEEKKMNYLRNIIQHTIQKGEAVEDDNFGDDEDDRSL